MPIICWGNLAKSAAETTRIEQSISSYIETHDENPNAHMGPDYALGAHRLQTILDHAPYSIFNRFTYPQARVYKAIVDPAGYGDDISIQAAIDYVNGLGGGSILVKAGVYIQAADLTLYSNIELVGEDNDATIIDFNGGNYCVSAVGTSGTHKRNINVRNLQVANAHDTDYGQFRMDYCDDCEFEMAYFKDGYDAEVGTTPDLTLYKSDRIKIKRSRFVNSGNVLSTNDCDHLIIKENYFYNSHSEVLTPAIGNDIIISENLFEENNGIAIYCETDPVGLSIINNTIIGQHATGINLDSPNKFRIIGNHLKGGTLSNRGIYLATGFRGVIEGNIIESFLDDGIRLNDEDYCSIIGNVSYNNGGYGINITNAACAKNTVVGNELLGNSAGPLNDLGTSTDAAHNIIA